MQPIPGGEVTVTLRSFSLSLSPDGLSPLYCLNCRKALDIHQPDADLPYRMLATCDACKCWHLVDCDAEAVHARITLLPEALLNGDKPSP